MQLEELAKLDERKSQVVEMRFFGGLSLDETAEALHISPDTVKRDWKLGRLPGNRGDTPNGDAALTLQNHDAPSAWINDALPSMPTDRWRTLERLYPPRRLERPCGGAQHAFLAEACPGTRRSLREVWRFS
jgi:hypothetical protein